MKPVMWSKLYFWCSFVIGLNLIWLSLALASETEIAFISGGIGQEERADMQAKQKNFNIWLSTASQGSGKYLSDVQISIVHAKNQQAVFNSVMDGPWLMLKLPSGHYELLARYQDSATQKQQVIRKSFVLQNPQSSQSLKKILIYFKDFDAAVSD